jgi:glycosyltransferase involved in cell wall biosynthesis
VRSSASIREPDLSTSHLKIIFATDNFGVGGTEMNAIRTAEALGSRVDLQVVAMQTDGPLRRRYEAAGIPVTSFPLSNMYGPAAMQQGWRLARWLRRARPDVVHCHDIYSNIFVGWWARIGGVRNVIASRRWGEDSSQPRLDRLNDLMSRRATRLLVNSDTIARGLIAVGRVRADRVVVLPNFLEPAAFELPSRDAVLQWRSALGIPSDRWIVGSVARLTPVKHHRLLLAALPRLLETVPTAHIVLVGDGPERPALEQEALASGHADRVTLTGTLPNRPTPHQLFDVSVLTSRSEGFPNSLVEAMAVSRPVVATDVGGVRDAVVDGETGLLVPGDDPGALADALIRLAREPQLAQQLGDAGRQRAHESFLESHVLGRLIRLYEELAR